MARPKEWTLRNCNGRKRNQRDNVQLDTSCLILLPGLSSGVAGDKRAGLDCIDWTEGVGLTLGLGFSMGDKYCLQ